MMLSQASKYALRATIYLAERPGTNHLSRDIAAAMSAPAQYLAKILQDLVRAGLLASAKGRGGGFRLALPSERIRLIQVVRAIEGDDYAEGCVLGLPTCSDESPCALHEVWKGSRAAFMRALEETVLKDLPPDVGLGDSGHATWPASLSAGDVSGQKTPETGR